MSNRQVFSCNRCIARKVKCDRRTPCKSCIRHKAECVFKAAPTLEKRPRRARDQVYVDRLKHYESLLQEHGINISKQSGGSDPLDVAVNTTQVVPKDQQMNNPSADSLSSRSVDKIQVVHSQGRSKVVEK
jgi:hypothetical protein